MMRTLNKPFAASLAALLALGGCQSPPPSTYEAIRAETLAATGPFAAMQIGPDQYALLTLLVQLVGAELAVEVGTFTGTSAVEAR